MRACALCVVVCVLLYVLRTRMPKIPTPKPPHTATAIALLICSCALRHLHVEPRGTGTWLCAWAVARRRRRTPACQPRPSAASSSQDPPHDHTTVRSPPFPPRRSRSADGQRRGEERRRQGTGKPRREQRGSLLDVVLCKKQCMPTLRCRCFAGYKLRTSTLAADAWGSKSRSSLLAEVFLVHPLLTRVVGELPPSHVRRTPRGTAPSPHPWPGLLGVHRALGAHSP